MFDSEDSLSAGFVIHRDWRWIMGTCRSDDLRARVVEAVACGSSRRAAADRFSVSVSSAIRWTARAAREGSAKPFKQGRPLGKGPLAAHLDYLIAAVEARPDITMPELASRLQTERGIRAAWASLSKLLCRAGFTYKKTADGIGMRTR
jgi:transposase